MELIMNAPLPTLLYIVAGFSFLGSAVCLLLWEAKTRQ